jgi:plastocyanin
MPARSQPRISTRPAVLAIMLVSLLVLAGCGHSSPAATAQDSPPVRGVTTIQMHDRRFQPAAIQVPADTKVTWVFTDGGRHHNVVGDGFSSPVQSRGAFTHVFDRAGSYPYRCTLHKQMHGRVLVT